MEITVTSTIEAWAEVLPDADKTKESRWIYNPAVFAIISGDPYSPNVTFRAIKESRKPETISYGNRDCGNDSSKDAPCTTTEKESQKYWRIIHISPPVAGFSVTLTSAGQPAGVRFTDTSTGSPSSWLWDFGDGWGSAEQNPEHTYETSGKYTATLRTANKGGEDTATTTVEVTVPEPEENAVSPVTDATSPSRVVLASVYPSGTVSVVHFNTTGAVIDDTGRSWVPTSLSYSNTVYKFGGGSALFNGAAWIYTNDDPALSPGSENFTFSAWVYPTTSLTGYGEVWGNWWTNQGGTSLDFSGGVPRIVYDNSGTTKIISGTRALPLNTWSNVVLQGETVSGASDVTLYVNGIPNGTITGAYNIRKPTSQTRFYIGRASTAHILLQAGTYVDDFFVVKGGPAMYTGPFTPPVHEFGSPEVPVANFTGTNLSGNSPRLVRFTDTSTGTPDTWNWSFGDGEYSEEQNPLHEYIIGQTYTVSLMAGNANGTSTEIKPDFISVLCPYSCDTTITDPPYILFGIYSVSCPEDNTPWHSAMCTDNTLIRWAKAGQSSSFYTNLSPWLWKPSSCCPGSGYSWAVDSPANLPIYYGAVTNEDTNNVYFHHHAVAAECLAAGDPRYSAWQDWNFFNYFERNITIGPGNQTPNGTSMSNTTVTINNISGVFGCGQPVEIPVVSYDIDLNNNIISHPATLYATGYIVSKTGKKLVENQDVPSDLDKVLRSMNDNKQFTISKWEFIPTSKELTLYVYDISKSQAIDDLQEKSVSGYSVRVVHDSAFEKNMSYVQQQLIQLRKNPDYKIATTAIIIDTLNNPPQNYVELWVYESTPENRKLDNTVINGWKIKVHPVSLPPSDIRKS